MAQRPRLATFSAYSSTEASWNLKRFCTTEVSSLILRPFSPVLQLKAQSLSRSGLEKPAGPGIQGQGIPRTFWVRVALTMISVRRGVTRTSTPEYPSSASSRVSSSFSSA